MEPLWQRNSRCKVSEAGKKCRAATRNYDVHNGWNMDREGQTGIREGLLVVHTDPEQQTKKNNKVSKILLEHDSRGISKQVKSLSRV